jgi:spermidine synthase
MPSCGGAGRCSRNGRARCHWLGTVDALQVDLYDHEAAAPVLDSADFYADCRRC